MPFDQKFVNFYILYKKSTIGIYLLSSKLQIWTKKNTFYLYVKEHNNFKLKNTWLRS